MAELPTTFGKYFLTEKLATGGMAEIYLAKLVGPGGFEKALVIKQIHPRLTGQRQFVDLFVAEAKTLVTLAHGNIVPVYELGVIEGTYFIAMDYIDGPTLYRLTEALARKGGSMEPPLAAWVIARIVDGLDYAHRKGDGVIHRDLSPRNVMLSRDGEVKLVDFGIAVSLGTDDTTSPTADAPPAGSFPYMSPEQVRREPLTGPSDLFSAGVLLWEMLTGQRLFWRADAAATLAAVLEAPIPKPSTAQPGVPPRLDEVTMRALARDPAARYSSAAEMLAQLQRYLYALDEPPGPRDVAALVARYCPPETRRLPTHADEATSDVPSGPVLAGPSTAVVPRPPIPGTAGVPRGNRARTETFATHVELVTLLRATPATATATATATAPETAPAPTPETAPVALDRGAPPASSLLTLAAIGTVALGAAAILFFVVSGSRVDEELRPDGSAVRVPADAARDLDAPVLDAPILDAALVPLDASATPVDPPPVRDAGIRPRPDAAALVQPTGTATLRIGATPWGEISVDGTPRGRTPAVLTVPAGAHTIQIRYPGDDPPRARSFTVDLADGATRELHADFSAP